MTEINDFYKKFKEDELTEAKRLVEGWDQGPGSGFCPQDTFLGKLKIMRLTAENRDFWRGQATQRQDTDRSWNKKVLARYQRFVQYIARRYFKKK